jgi:hypothetical protein
MKSAIQGICVFSLTFIAHDEIGHRCIGPIVRQFFDNGKPGAAMGAVYERVKISTIIRIEDFGQTVRAGTDVRKNKRGFFAGGVTFSDLENSMAHRVKIGKFKTLNKGMRRFLLFYGE